MCKAGDCFYVSMLLLEADILRRLPEGTTDGTEDEKLGTCISCAPR